MVYGRAFLSRGAELARASLVAATWMNDKQFETLFLNGVCLRDAEPALPPQTDHTAGVSVEFTLAGNVASPPAAEAPVASDVPPAQTPKFCTHCGAPASTGPYCAQCGNVITAGGDA